MLYGLCSKFFTLSSSAKSLTNSYAIADKPTRSAASQQTAKF